MLILTRKRAETIQIGDHVIIKVIRTGKNTVKLGIEAPADVRVLRGELAFEGVADRERDILELNSGLFNQPEEFAVCSDQFPHPHIA
jgi:carbon storage regulator